MTKYLIVILLMTVIFIISVVLALKSKRELIESQVKWSPPKDRAILRLFSVVGITFAVNLIAYYPYWIFALLSILFAAEDYYHFFKTKPPKKLSILYAIPALIFILFLIPLYYLFSELNVLKS